MNGAFTPDDPIRAALERAIGFQYQISRLLGRGGMGAVYHAHERALDRAVAIKVLPPDIARMTCVSYQQVFSRSSNRPSMRRSSSARWSSGWTWKL